MRLDVIPARKNLVNRKNAVVVGVGIVRAVSVRVFRVDVARDVIDILSGETRKAFYRLFRVRDVILVCSNLTF